MAVPGSKISGIDGIIELRDEAGTVIGEIPMLESWTLESSVSLNTDEGVVMLSNGDGGSSSNNNWSKSDIGVKSWSLSSEHYWQEDDAVETTGVADATQVGFRAFVNLYPNTSDTGKVRYSGEVILESVSVPSEASGKIKQSLTFKGDGELAREIIT